MNSLVKIKIPFFLILLVLLSPTSAQTWSVNFGTSSGSYTTSSGFSNSFIPSPGTGGGTTRVSIGSAGQQSGFYLNNPGIVSLGTGTELRGTGPSGTAANKFSVYDYSPSTEVVFSFDVIFGGNEGSNTAPAGEWYLMIGDGQVYSDNTSASNNPGQGFVVLRWTFGPSGSLSMDYHDGSDWINILMPAGNTFEQTKKYNVRIFGNNSLNLIDYLNTSAYTLVPDSWDLWINNIRVGVNLRGGGLAQGANIDSWLIAGEKSNNDRTSVFMDDLSYSNDLPAVPKGPLPIQLLSFAGERSGEDVLIRWTTATETNNDYFTLERSYDALIFSEVQKIAGAGNSNLLMLYEASDPAPADRLLYYRLRQTDYDGTSTLSHTIAIQPNMDSGSSVTGFTASGGKLSIDFKGFSGRISIRIFSLAGLLVATSEAEANEGNASINLPLARPGTTFIFQLSSAGKTVSQKFVMQ